MKNIIFAIVVFFATGISYTQENIQASEIIKAIKAGEDIKYSNKTIIGQLDFTLMEETIKEKTKKKSSWWNKKIIATTQLITTLK